MPYYYVIRGFSYRTERGDSVHEILDRPISFVEKLRIGKRKFGFVGPKEIEVDITNHDKAKVTALRDTTLVLRAHEENPEEAKIVDANHPLSPRDNPPEKQGYKRVKLVEGAQFDLHRTSLMVEGSDGEQVMWSPSLGGPGDDIFADFATKTLKEGF